MPGKNKRAHIYMTTEDWEIVEQARVYMEEEIPGISLNHIARELIRIGGKRYNWSKMRSPRPKATTDEAD